MDVTVREAKTDDLSAVQKLGTELMVSDMRFDPLLEEHWYTTEAGTKYLLSRIEDHDRVCLVAELQGEIIGYATGSLLDEETWRPVKRTELENLIVSEKYRSHGAGHELMSTFKQWSKDQGAGRIKVLSNAGNEGAIHFYNDTGFAHYHVVLEADLGQGSTDGRGEV